MNGRRPWIALLALALSGCSFVFVKPSAEKPLDVADCTDGYGAPIVDTLVSATAVVATAYAASRSDNGRQGFSLDREDAVVGYGVAAAFFAGSAAAGYSRVHACREAKAPPALALKP